MTSLQLREFLSRQRKPMTAQQHNFDQVGQVDLGADGGETRSSLQAPQAKPVRPAYNIAILKAWFSCSGVSIPEPAFEYAFHPTRKWRFDLAWPAALLALEVQGGVWRGGGGAHTGAGAVRDYEKFSEAACLGWRVLFCQPAEIMTEATAIKIRRALKLETQPTELTI